MKLILDLLVLIARFGVFVGGTLSVLFVIYLLTGPAQRAWEEAEQLEERRRELVQEEARLLASVQASERERRLAGEEHHQRMLEAESVRSTRLPLAEHTVRLAEEARLQAERTQEATQGRLRELLAQDHGFGSYTGHPRQVEAWSRRQVRAIEARCRLRMTQLDFWREPITNFSARWTCSEALERAERLEAWARNVARVVEETEALERWKMEAEERALETSQQMLRLREEADTLESTALDARAREEMLSAQETEEREALAEVQRESAAVQRELDGFSGWLMGQRERLDHSLSWLADQWRAFWWKGLMLVLGIWALPYLWRTLLFWGVAPLLMRAPAIRLLAPEAPGGVTLHRSERVAAIEVPPGTAIAARADHVRQVEVGVSRTRWFYDLQFPFLSYVAGLFLLTEVRASADREKPVKLTLAATGEHSADTYVLRMDLQDHPGLVISARHLIAVSDGLTLDAHWRPWNLHAWARGQLRYVTLAGTGSLWIQGFGDVHGETLEGTESHQTGEAYLCFDARLLTRTRRRETFWPYLLGRVPLLEVGMAGHGIFAWQKSTEATGMNALQKAWHAFWSALGKFLGF